MTMKKIQEMTINPKAFTEVKTILNETGLIALIPENEQNVILHNMDTSYSFRFDNTIPLENQDLLDETKALLAYYHKKYLI